MGDVAQEFQVQFLDTKLEAVEIQLRVAGELTGEATVLTFNDDEFFLLATMTWRHRPACVTTCARQGPQCGKAQGLRRVGRGGGRPGRAARRGAALDCGGAVRADRAGLRAERVYVVPAGAGRYQAGVIMGLQRPTPALRLDRRECAWISGLLDRLPRPVLDHRVLAS